VKSEARQMEDKKTCIIASITLIQKH